MCTIVWKFSRTYQCIPFPVFQACREPGVMRSMEIRFGRPIVSIDGERVGLVDSLILDSECRYVRQIRILHGIDERSVPYHAVASVNEDGILDLTLTAFEVQQTSRQHSESADRFDRRTMPFTTWVTGETLAPSFTPGVQPNPPHRPA